MRFIATLLLILTFIGIPATLAAPAPLPEPNIGVKGSYAARSVRRGGRVSATVTMDIPAGYHVNANKPLGKYAIPTVVKIDAPKGVSVSAITYPRGVVRRLKAVNNERLALYEGRAIFRFTVTVPTDYSDGSVNLKARVRYQSCNDEVCFPPKNQDIDMSIRVDGPIFGGKHP